ncbi:MAG: NAD(P)-dependent oxidoreductase [Flavobacteriaceae bacterium]|nr:NAD(P)-dependent oxidoreductase [Flavobacteriaceae bacterium]
MIFAFIKERKNPPDRRVVCSPQQIALLKQQYPTHQFIVEASDIRIFSDQAYQDYGIDVHKDVSHADVLIGVKEVPVDALIPDKSYFFFSHTIKKQTYNKNLLRRILALNIDLYDHETITTAQGHRLIGFGRYAGLVGAYNAIRLLGQRDELFDLPKAEDLPDLNALLKSFDAISLPHKKIVLTGSGKVAYGAKEILDHLHIHEVSVEEFLHQAFDEPVYVLIDVLDYNRRKDGKNLGKKDFYQHPEAYESDFIRFAKVADIFIAGHFYGDGAPYLFTREDAKNPDFNIDLIADISCDIDGPVASTIRPSTIAEPFYAYHPLTEKEVPVGTPHSIAVMAVDNLPCELPKDASEGFGEMFLEHVFPAFFNEDASGILQRAQITKKGKLTESFLYLQDWVYSD